MTNKHIALALSGTLVLAACDFDVPDLNRPLLDQVTTNPTPALATALATGLVNGERADIAQRIGYVSELGILGRESYVFSGSDDRFVTELLIAPSLDPSTPNFGGNFWLAEYENQRNANLLLDMLPQVVGLTDAEKESIRGFAKTVMALDLLKVIDTHDVNGACIDVDLPIGQLAPIVGKDAVFARIALLLDQAQAHLTAAGTTAFPFALGNGFTSFKTPANFLLVNRAVAARVAVYRGQFAAALTALAASFIDPATPGGTPASSASLAPFPGTGVFHAYGNGSGDTQNNLNTSDILAHPSIVTDAEQLAAPPAGCSGLTGDAAFAKACLDNRVMTKVVAVSPVSGVDSLSSGYGFNMYPNTDSLVPIIRNEELILLRAEANIGLGNIGAAKQDIDYIRVNSGGIGPSTGLNAGNILDALLKQKRYSLLFEGGHRWIDARRYNKLGTLPIDRPDQRVQTAFPIPQSEVNARGG
jgi:hypothetical protein